MPDLTLGQKRCLARHHDWSDAGTCRRPGCKAARADPTKPRTQREQGHAEQAKSNAQVTPPGEPDPKSPSANPADPISRLKAKRKSATITPDKIIPPEEDREEDEKDEDSEAVNLEDFVPTIAVPLVLGATCGAARWICKKRRRECDDPTDEAKEDAGEKISAWAIKTFGKGPKLGPLGQMGFALLCLGGGMVIGSHKIEDESPPPKPPKQKQKPNDAPDAATRSAPTGALALVASTRHPANPPQDPLNV